MTSAFHVDIKAPCHEDWQHMQTSGQDRHCLACQKTVVDFTRMSDGEILRYLQQAGARVCGRFRQEQLNKTYTAPQKNAVFSFRYGWGVLVSTYLLVSQPAGAHMKSDAAVAWIANPIGTRRALPGGLLRAEVVVRDSIRTIEGVITDETSGEPLAGVVVVIKGTVRGTVTDPTGRFTLRVEESIGKIRLVASVVGYHSREVPVNARKKGAWQIRLKMHQTVLGEIAVVPAGPGDTA